MKLFIFWKISGFNNKNNVHHSPTGSDVTVMIIFSVGYFQHPTLKHCAISCSFSNVLSLSLSLSLSFSHSLTLSLSSGMFVAYASVGLVVTVIVLALALLVFYRKWRAGNRKSPELSDCLALDNHAAGQVRGFQPCTRTQLYTSTHTHTVHM